MQYVEEKIQNMTNV